MNACTDRFAAQMPNEERITRQIVIDPETSNARVLLAVECGAVIETYPHHHTSKVTARTVRPYDSDWATGWDEVPTVDLFGLLSPETRALVTAELMVVLAAGRLDSELIDSTD